MIPTTELVCHPLIPVPPTACRPVTLKEVFPLLEMVNERVSDVPTSVFPKARLPETVMILVFVDAGTGVGAVGVPLDLLQAENATRRTIGRTFSCRAMTTGSCSANEPAGPAQGRGTAKA